MENKDYFIGLDIGSGSVGWAVTDTNYNVLKKKKKFMWGSFLTGEATSAEERRNFRCARRNNRRKKDRIYVLQELFAEAINKVDQGFFHRLKESKYTFEDKQNEKGQQVSLPYNLFVDEKYTDKDFYNEFPTIYHLRYALLTSDKKFDIRLIYLAVAHIIKHRGHFLSNMSYKEIGTVTELNNIINSFVSAFNEILNNNIVANDTFISQLVRILKSKKINNKNKVKELEILFNIQDNKDKEILKLLVGNSANLQILFSDKTIPDECAKISFEDAAYIDKEGDYQDYLENEFELIEKTKNLYNWIKLSDILELSDQGYISEVKIKLYDKHKKDLKVLKKAVRKYAHEEYLKFFSIDYAEKGNYPAYVKVKNLKTRVSTTKEEFYKFIKKHLLDAVKDFADNIDDESKNKYIEEKYPELLYIKREIDQGDFMPRLRSIENSIIPYQVHEKELITILDNAAKHYDFLNNIDKEYNISVKDKICSLLTFKIPFYVGPLNDYHKDKNGYAWVERIEKGKVYPWNFEQKVNIEKTAENFIVKMTNKCAYLKNEDVLPKASILYEKFTVLNEINNIKIDGVPISVELKQSIFIELFQKYKTVTFAKLFNFLKQNGFPNIKKSDISGIDVTIQGSLNSYIAFNDVFEKGELSMEEEEDIIKDVSLFKSAPNILMQRMQKKYPDKLEKIKRVIPKIKNNGWGRLSKEFLDGKQLAVEVEGKGKIGTIIYQMWHTNCNLMQLLSNSYPYIDMINNVNATYKKEESDKELIQNICTSPNVKHQLLESLKIIKKIVKIMKCEPKRIFIEMARSTSNTGITISRKKQLLDTYDKIRKNKNTKNAISDELYKQLQDTDDNILKNNKIYLYFTQLGRCAYSGEKISLSILLGQNGRYDIDHIYPQSITADDSITQNKVLVNKQINAAKTDKYPLDVEIRDKMKSTWELWLETGLITKIKFNRLISENPLSQDQLMSFVGKQLAETRQSTKILAHILEGKFQDTEVVFVKAKNVSLFRQQFGFIKVRELNNLHHAKDAYLNIVVGNAYHLYFNKDIRKFFSSKGFYRTYNLMKIIQQDKDILYKDEIGWIKGEQGTIKTITKYLSSNKVLVTKQCHEGKGKLFDVMPVKKKASQLVPLKKDPRLNHTEKYGGYDAEKTAYFTIISGLDKKDRPVKFIEAIPIRFRQKYIKDEKWAIEYLTERLKGKVHSIKIEIKKILLGTLFEYNGFKMRIAGKSGTSILFHNANEAYFDSDTEKVLKEVFKFKHDRNIQKDYKINPKSGLTDDVLNALYDCLKDKLTNTIYREYKTMVTKVINGQKEYKKLSLEDKALAIADIYKIFQCTPEMPTMQLLKEKAEGPMRISHNITKRENLKIIF